MSGKEDITDLGTRNLEDRLRHIITADERGVGGIEHNDRALGMGPE